MIESMVVIVAEHFWTIAGVTYVLVAAVVNLDWWLRWRRLSRSFVDHAKVSQAQAKRTPFLGLVSIMVIKKVTPSQWFSLNLTVLVGSVLWPLFIALILFWVVSMTVGSYLDKKLLREPLLRKIAFRKHPLLLHYIESKEEETPRKEAH